MGKTNNKYLSFPDPLLAISASEVSPSFYFISFGFYKANFGVFLSSSALSRAFLLMENSKVPGLWYLLLMRISTQSMPTSSFSFMI